MKREEEKSLFQTLLEKPLRLSGEVEQEMQARMEMTEAQVVFAPAGFEVNVGEFDSYAGEQFGAMQGIEAASKIEAWDVCPICGDPECLEYARMVTRRK